MSSHHIVRDEQEPAVIITDWHDNYWKAIRELLGWTPTVVVATQAVGQLLSKGIKIDIVVGSQNDLAQLFDAIVDQQPLKQINSDNAENSLNQVINFLIDRNYRSVNIFGQLDTAHPANTKMNTIWYDENSRWVQSKNGQFKKWMTEGSMFSLHPTQSYNLSNATENHGAYHVTKDDFVIISGNDQFWVSEPY